MSYQNGIISMARPVGLTLLAVAVLLVVGVACRGGGDATPTPAFSLPTALPSPEAVPADGGSRRPRWPGRRIIGPAPPPGSRRTSAAWSG